MATQVEKASQSRRELEGRSAAVYVRLGPARQVKRGRGWGRVGHARGRGYVRERGEENQWRRRWKTQSGGAASWRGGRR